MGYADQNEKRHQWGSKDIGAGDITLALKGEKGKEGIITGAGLAEITEAFTNTTLSGRIQLGVSGDLTKHLNMDLGVAAIGNVYNTVDDPDAIIDVKIPADTQLIVTLKAPTGGTPAGIGVPYIDVSWH